MTLKKNNGWRPSPEEDKMLYKSFDKLGVDTRSGITIELNQSGNLKVRTYSAHTDNQDYVYYIRPTDEFNANTDWDAPLNDCMTYWEALLHEIEATSVYFNQDGTKIIDGIYYRKAAVK